MNLFYTPSEKRKFSFKQSLFLELLAIFLKINLNTFNVFESIQYFEETKEEFELLSKYL